VLSDAISLEINVSHPSRKKTTDSSPGGNEPQSSLKLKKRSKVIEKLKELTEKQKRDQEIGKRKQMDKFDFSNSSKPDAYLAVLQAKQTLHADLKKLETYHQSSEDLRAPTAVSKSDGHGKTKGDNKEEQQHI